MNTIPYDVSGRVIKVGDCIACREFDFGSVVRVVAIEAMGAALSVRVASRGRVCHYVPSKGWRIVSR